jgi:hypothetical protein
MNPHILLCSCWLLLGTSNIIAAGAPSMEEANQRFAANDFAAAAAAYEQILTTDGPRAAVFYNLGNSYQRQGQYGRAILAYERARLLTPRDPDLLANLTLARKAAAAFEEPLLKPRLDALIKHLSRNEWSWLVTGCALFLGGIALLCGILRLPRKWLRQTVVMAAVVAGLGITGGATALYLRRSETTRGIVLSSNAKVLISPFGDADTLGTPGAGRSVRLGRQEGDFIYLEVIGTKLCGWMSNKDVAAISGDYPSP